MYMNKRDCTIHFEDKHLLMQKMQKYDHSIKIKTPACNNYKYMALSLARLAAYSTVNE